MTHSLPKSAASAPAEQRPFLGHGVGLRVPHYPRALRGELDVDFVEVISENFFGKGGRPREVLERTRATCPVVLHGVSLGIGSPDAPCPRYMRQLRELAAWVEPAWISDHLCWTSIGGRYSHDLLPLPLTEEALDVVTEHTERVQDALGHPLVLENVSSYVAYRHSALHEWEFLTELCRRTDCKLLVDLNNIIVSAHNHGWNVEEYLAGLPAHAIWQFHLANHDDRGHYRFDSHRGAVPEAVWRLYESALKRFGAVSSLVEWDEEVPDWEVLRAQQVEARRRAEALIGPTPVAPASPPSPRGHNLEATARSQPQPSNTQNSQLHAIQELTWRAIRWPTGIDEFLAQASAEEQTGFEAIFDETSSFDRAARLSVYADAYFYRQLGVLEEIFEVTAWLLGKTGFHNLVTDYLWRSPSQSADIRGIGTHFADFIGEHPVSQKLPGLAQIAEIEQCVCAALDVENDSVLTAERIASLQPEQLAGASFRPGTASQLVPGPWDFNALDETRRTGRPPSEQLLEQRAAWPKLEPGLGSSHSTCATLIWRRDLKVRTATYHGAQAQILSRALAGTSFGELCTSPVSSTDGASASPEPAQVVQWLSDWVAAEVFADLVL